MAGRVNSSTRAIQKKLRKIVKDVLKTEEIQGILDNIGEPTPAMEFLLEEDGIDKYGDNVHAFKSDIDACCKFFSKVRGKRQDAVRVSEMFTSMLEAEFPDIFEHENKNEVIAVESSGRKRGRASTGSAEVEVTPEKPAKKKAARQEKEEEEVASTLATAEKNALKSIVNKLIKCPEAEYFVYPVDAKMYPEYYEIIKHPMDLTTIKERMAEYSTIEQCLGDLRLVWDNCRQFNAEGSDILQSAEECAVLLETLVAEKLGEEYVLKKKPSSSSSKARKNKHTEPQPAASEVVQTETEIKHEKMKRKRSNSHSGGGNSINQHKITQKGWPIHPRTYVQLPHTLHLPQNTLKKLSKFLTDNTYSEPFLSPVNPRDAPGYLDLIEFPMDIGTLKKRVSAGMYDADSSKFIQEARLIWENCVSYNDPNSEIAVFAGNLAEGFETELHSVLVELHAFTEEEGGERVAAGTAAATNHTATSSSSAVKQKNRKVKEEEQPLPTTTATTTTAPTNEEETETRKPLSLTIKKMKRILKEFYKDDRSLPFREPVPVDLVPGYADIIKRPMDLYTMKTNLTLYEDNPKKFLADLCLIFDNCQLFNVEECEIYKNAGLLRELAHKLYDETFPSVEQLDEAAAAALKAKQSNKARKHSAANEDLEGKHAPGAGSSTSTKTARPDHIIADVVASSSNDTVAAPLLPVVVTSAVAPAIKTSSRVPSLPIKLEDITALVQELSDASKSPAFNQHVRDRAFAKAHDKLRATRLPYTVVPDLYVVKRFGDLYPDYKCHDEEYIYPIGYTCSRQMRICLLPIQSPTEEVDMNNTSASAWVSLELKSTVFVGGSQGNEAQFQVALENGTVLNEAATPTLAWEGLIGKEIDILELLGSKMKRCRAVFNRIMVSPDALPFLEMVPLTGPLGQDYYSVITAPMWFREVHSRLVEGTYDVEFDFAWDMRLIFKNCMTYNAVGSELYEAAERLSEAFEYLFTNWVLNVQDRSVSDLAKGPWNQWQHQRYFDLADPTTNICAITGTKAPASHMLQCMCCEDQNLASLHPPVPSKSLWVCARCQDALDMAGGDLTKNPFSAAGFKLSSMDVYSCEEFGNNTYVPVFEHGVGWNQAKRRQRGGLKNSFLSPLGYEVNDIKDIHNQIVYENVVNENLYTARAAEFQEFIKTTSPRHEAKKTARHKRNRTTPMSPEKSSEESDGLTQQSAATTSAPAIDPLAAEEAGRIPTGKLYDYKLPEGHRLAWFTTAHEEEVLRRAQAGQDVTEMLSDRVELTAELLPKTGYFGFDIPSIRSRIEGVEGSSTCESHAYSDTEKHKEAILEELSANKRRLDMLASSEAALQKVLLEERWRFEKQLLSPPRPQSAETQSSLEHKSGFSPLFPQSFHVDYCDTLLSVWEFLYSCPSLNRLIDCYSLHDLICSLSPPATPLTNYGQVVFDEVCVSFANVLLNEVRQRRDIKDEPRAAEEKDWQESLLVRPLNIVTWPSIALESLRLLSSPLSISETRALLDMHRAPAISMKQRDIFCLLLNHPVIDTFLMLIPTPAEGFTGKNPNAVTMSLRALKEHFSSVEKMTEGSTDETSSFYTINTYAILLRNMFVSVLEEEKEEDANTVRYLHAHCILQYLTELFKRWNIEVPPLDYTNIGVVPTVEDLEERLNAAKLKPCRFWGGYTMSNIEKIPSGQVVLPRCFNARKESTYEQLLQALNNLERTMLLLSTSEPESWEMQDRTAVYLTLLDYGVNTKEYAGSAYFREKFVFNKLNVYVEHENVAIEHMPAIEVVKHTPPGTRCHFTGIEVDHSMERVQWVAVPPTYLNAGGLSTPSVEAIGAPATPAGRGMRSVNNTYTGPVALHIALMKVITARETALADARRHENRVVTQLQPTLYQDPKTTALYRTVQNHRSVPDPLRSPSHCSEPLGYDRYGNSYWILSPQEASTLFPYQPNGAAIHISTGGASTASVKLPVEPCLLIREVSGWWGYHNGTELPALLSSFSSEMICERVLILKLIEKLAYTRCYALRSILTVRAMQRDWVVRRIRTEQWVHNVKMPAESLPAVQMNRLLELVWSRCVEVRNQLHTSSLYKLDDDPVMSTPRAERENLLKKQKKIREVLTDDTFEHHLVKGWNRCDALQKIRQTAASTTATRLVADPSIYPYLINNIRRTPLLIKNAPEFSVVPNQAVGGEEGEEEGDEPRKLASAPSAPAVVASESAETSTVPAVVASESAETASAPAVVASESAETASAPAVVASESAETSTVSAVVASESAETSTVSAVVATESAETSTVPAVVATDCTQEAASTVNVPELPTQVNEPSASAEAPRNGTVQVTAAEVNSEQMDVVEPATALTAATAMSDAPAKEEAGAMDVVEEASAAADPSEQPISTEAIQSAADPSEQPINTEATQSAGTAAVGSESKETVPSATGLPPPQLQGLAGSAAPPGTVKFVYPPIPAGRVLPDLRAIIHANTRPGYEPKSKAVEMVHLVTGELLRIFPSTKDAAAFFGVAQSNISLCVHTTKADYLGFKWRLYTGPPFLFEMLENLQPSRAICMAMHVTKPMRETYSLDEERLRIAQLVAEEQRVNPHLYRSPGTAPVSTIPALPSINTAPGHALPSPEGTAFSLPSAPPRPASGGYQPGRPMPPNPASGSYQPGRPMPPNLVPGGYQSGRPMPPNLVPGGYQSGRPMASGTYNPAMAGFVPIPTSTEVVSARMLRLKSELLNIFYLMPEKSLRLPALDEAGEKAIADEGAAAANKLREGLAKMSASAASTPVPTAAAGEAPIQPGQERESVANAATTTASTVMAPAGAGGAIDYSQSNVERLADKAARKAKRRLRRKLSMEKFLKDTQDASTPQQLLNMILTLESALPPTMMYKCHRQQLSLTADTLASAAVRLYALDRSIAYDEVRVVENQVLPCPYSLRKQFYPRCVVQSNCNRYIGHCGKCATMLDASATRIPEFQDLASITRAGPMAYQYQTPRPAGTGASHSAATAQALANQRRMQYMQQLAALKPKDEDQPLAENLKKLLQVRKELDIEFIQPYYPIKDITVSDWI